jgi:ribonuclease D
METLRHDPLHCRDMPVPDPVLVDQPGAVARAVAAAADAPLIALDTEFVRTTQFAPRLCLVQFAAGAEVFCLDELAGLELAPLWDILLADGLRILHAAKQDLEVIYLRYGRLPARIIDTQIAAALTGHPAQVGYAGLVQTLLGVEVDKTHTRADWSLRPLAPALIDYGASDVLHLPEVYSRLRDRLEALGRYAWVEEDSARLIDPALYAAAPDLAWRRLGVIPQLPVPAQLRARRLARLREELAIRADRPRQWILTDRALLDIAMKAPADAVALAACDDVAPGFARRQAARVLAEIEAATAEFAAGTDLVQEPRPDVIDPGLLKRLSRVTEACGRELGIAPELLATRRDLTAMVRGDADARPLQGWRRDVIGVRLEDALRAG